MKKKKYFSPEIDITKLNFEDLMKNIDLSTPEETQQTGDIDDGDDIGG